MIRNTEDQWGLIESLINRGECEWIEFKRSYTEPTEIGEYISALANGSALCEQQRGFKVWGIDDKTLAAVGTTFDPRRVKIGNESLENWLSTQLKPQVSFLFSCFTHSGMPMVMLAIDAAFKEPVRFKGEAYIRVGEHKKLLKDHSDLQQQLWRVLNATAFETQTACDGMSTEQILHVLDYQKFYALSGRPIPEKSSQILNDMDQFGLIDFNIGSGWSILNLGAILFARDIRLFPTVARRSVRVERYEGDTKSDPVVKEQVGQQGYAAGFEGLVDYVMGQLPERQVIDGALRVSKPYPVEAVRELIANALIHQDFGVTGAGPMIEIFNNRVEISNPGVPLVSAERFIDALQRSRNERIAYVMRLCRICEERGSGWDRVTWAVEYHQLPPPLVEVAGSGTTVVLFGPRPLDKMGKTDRIRAIYQHACLRWVNRQDMTNSTVRDRFGLGDKDKPKASRMIREALDAGVIVAYDPMAGPRSVRYVPFWSVPDDDGGMA